jgi:DNA repair protein RadC
LGLIEKGNSPFFFLIFCQSWVAIPDHHPDLNMTYCLRIADLPPDERPREKLALHGVHALSNAELLALLLGTGQGAGKLSAVGLGQYLLHQIGQNQQDSPIAILRHIRLAELTKVDGIGPAKGATILAAIELGKRIYQSRPPERAVVDDPSIAANALSHELMWQSQEHFAVLMLDVKHRIMAQQVVTIGTATETLAHPREIFREAIRQSAARVVVAHNHPSGSLEASPEDIQLTRQLLKAAQILGIPMLDHLILGNGDFISLREQTCLWEEIPQD